ncbi:hypothetical protein GVB59_002873 [Salmonella enterica]|nr:hypothetical protein [Salmonella enterica]
MKTQANTPKCPLNGSVKSTEKSAIKVTIRKLNEFSTDSSHPLVTGLVAMVNRFITPLFFKKRYFILLGERRDMIHPVTGYAVIDAFNRDGAINQAREILNTISLSGMGNYYITLAVRTGTYTRDLHDFAAFCHAEWVINEVEYEKA